MTHDRELELAFEYHETLASLDLAASDVERVERVPDSRRRIVVHTTDGRAIRAYDFDRDPS
jgi:hypothetical protein